MGDRNIRDLVLRLPDLRLTIGEPDLELKPELFDLLVDHWCLLAAIEEWRARQPRERRAALLPAWIAEGKEAFGALDELKARARAFGSSGAAR